MCNKTKHDKIINDNIRERVEIPPIVEKKIENKLRWYEHVEKKLIDSMIRRVYQIEKGQTIRDREISKKNKLLKN